MIPTKAVLLDVRAYLADSNIRRSASSFSVNYGSSSEDVLMRTLTIEPGQTLAMTTPMNPSVMTMLRTSQLVDVTVTLRSGPSFTVKVSKLLVLDDDAATLSVHSPSDATGDTKLNLLQG